MNIHKSDYFNPFVRFPDVSKKFHALDLASRAKVIALSILAAVGTIFIGGLGGLAAYRYLVQKLHPDKLPPDSAKTDQKRKEFFQQKPSTDGHGSVKTQGAAGTPLSDESSTEDQEGRKENRLSDLFPQKDRTGDQGSTDSQQMGQLQFPEKLPIHGQGSAETDQEWEELFSPKPSTDDQGLEETQEMGGAPLPGKPSTGKEPSIYASRTQYDPRYQGHGTSACTVICAVAARRLLERSWDDITAETLDGILDEGVDLYRELGLQGHSSFDDVDLQAQSLQRVPLTPAQGIESLPFEGMVTDFTPLLAESSDFPQPASLIITKPPITIAVIRKSKDEYWVFDSHGKDGRGAYLEKYADQSSLNTALKQKFPYVAPEDMANKLMFDLTYNAFQAYAVRELDGVGQ